MARTFLSPGERRLLDALDRCALPEETRGDGLETEGDVVRRLMDTFDAQLLDAEPSRAPQPGESEQLALLGAPPTVTPPPPRAYRD